MADRTDDIMTDDTVTEPEQLRREIAATRADMDRTLAQLEDRVSPTRIRERQTERLQSRWRQTRERVMGAPDHLGDRTMGGDGGGARERVSQTASQARESAENAPERVEEMTRGNPLAAGMIAFGLGALAASVLPSTGPERRLASELRDEFEEPVRQELRSAGEEVKTELQDHAQQAAEDTKQTARDAMDRTKQDTQRSTDQVKEHARDNAQTLRDQAR